MLRVRDVMTTQVVSVGPDASFAEVADALLDHDVSGLPVVDADGGLLGVVSETDLVAREAYGYRRRRALALLGDYLRGRNPTWVSRASGRGAAELMTPVPDTVSPDEELAVAARRMLEFGHKRLPVIDGSRRLVGIVSRHDLLRPFRRSDEEIASDITGLLADVTRIPESNAVLHAVSHGVVRLEGSVQWPRDVRLVEAFVGCIPGVVAVDNCLLAREPEPSLPR